jgi:DNA polymerase-3 subunit gamma/tau
MNLALKYRPRNFNDVVGQKAISVILNAMVVKDRLSQVLLFTGPSGTGKTTMARIIAAELNPDAKEDVYSGTHPSVLEIDAASNGSVAAIRNLKKDLNFYVPGKRVVIIDEVHSISPEAFDALLNLLEFPPENVYLILCTTEIQALEPAIRHRCDRYNFKTASIEDLLERLNYVNSTEQFGVSDDLLNLIAQRSEGSYRESMMLLEQLTAAEITTVEEYNNLNGEVDYGPGLISSSISGPSAAVSKLESVLRYTNTEEISDRTVETLRDLMLLKAGVKLGYSEKALSDRIDLASKLGTDQILKAIRIMWDLQTKLSNSDPTRGLEMAYALIGQALQKEETARLAPPVPKPMSLDAMRTFS